MNYIKRDVPTNLQHLVNRINQFTKWIETQPERKDHWEAKIEETKALIVKVVLEHDKNPALKGIHLKDTVFKTLRHMDDDGYYRYWVREMWYRNQDDRIRNDPETLFNKAQNDPESGFSIDIFVSHKEVYGTADAVGDNHPQFGHTRHKGNIIKF